MNDEPTTDDVDARSEGLMREFDEHRKEFYAKVRTEHPELLEPDDGLVDHKIFEGWCIQKIAGLQVLIERMCRE